MSNTDNTSGAAWDTELDVECVVCPECAFTFAADHTDTDGGGYSCPLCQMKHLCDVLLFADGLAVARTGFALADLYAADCEWAQAALRAAGCHPRGSLRAAASGETPTDNEVT